MATAVLINLVLQVFICLSVYLATVKKVSKDRQSDETEILLVILRQPEEPVAGFFSQ